jgi:AcrR family transcriptional regulator
MPRPTRLGEQKQELLPILASAFGQLGYRRATTAELARRCGVRENILYRHWRDKLEMFVAALDHVRDLALATWRRVLDQDGGPAAAGERLLDYEARHLGEFGHYRIIFSALGDADQPEIRDALRRMYGGFWKLIRTTLSAARGGRAREPKPDQAAWAIIGLGTIATILGELGLLSDRKRAELIAAAGRVLLAGSGRADRRSAS